MPQISYKSYLYQLRPIELIFWYCSADLCRKALPIPNIADIFSDPVMAYMLL